MACFGLAKLGIETKPLHVALGLDNEEPSNNGGASDEGSGSGDDNNDESGDESTSDLPPFLDCIWTMSTRCSLWADRPRRRPTSIWRDAWDGRLLR